LPRQPLRIIVVTAPMTGHFWPLVPLAWALRAAGHDVRVASLPHIAGEVAAAGLPGLHVGPEADLMRLLQETAEDPPDDPANPFAHVRNLRGLVRWNARMATLLIDGLMEPIRAERPDVIVHGGMEMAGPLLSGLLGVPAVKYPLGLPMRDNVVTGLRRGGAALRVRYGMPDRPGEPAMVLDVCPSGLRPGPEPSTLHRQPMRYLPYNGSGAIAEWAWEPQVRRRVCVTNSVDPGDVIDVEPLLALAAAVADDETEVVVPLPAHRLEGTHAPDGVRLVEWMPLHIAARSCAAVVHAGDPLSTFTFLSVGVPQLIRPAMSDEVRHGAAVEQAGAGRSVRADQPLEASVRALRELLADDDCRKRAEALAEEIRSLPSLIEVVAKIEALTAG